MILKLLPTYNPMLAYLITYVINSIFEVLYFDYSEVDTLGTYSLTDKIIFI